QILGSFRIRDGEPGRRKESADIAATAAISAVVTSRMFVMRDRQLRAAIGQVGYADFLSAVLNDVVDTPKRHGRQILAVRVTWPVLDCAGHAHVALGLRKPWGYFRIVDRPVLAEAIQICCLEINIAKARGGSAPEIRLPAGRLAPLPVPIRSWRIGIGDVVFE